MQKIFTHPLFILQSVCIICLYLLFGKYITDPNEFILQSTGDGMKNYFTSAWFVKYDQGTHFTGMNYPYGEHVIFTDNQPALSWILSALDKVIPVSDNVVGIMNIFMFLSLLLCTTLLFYILKHYGASAWYAVLVSLLITFMNPQLKRVVGHYALSYSFFIPLIWWVLILLIKKNYPYRYLILLSLIIIAFSFIHLYYLLIAILFLTSFLFVKIIMKQAFKKEIISLLFLIIIPFLFVFSFLKFTDSVKDRVSEPYGFFAYEASVQSVFLPQSGKLAEYIYSNQILPLPNPEGYAYIGFFSSLLALFFIIRFIFQRFYKKQPAQKIIYINHELKIFFIASILSLLFSFAFPFSLGMKNLVEHIPLLTQFRSLGRFSWIFYFVFRVVSFIYLFYVFKYYYPSYKIASVFILFSILCLSINETRLHANKTKMDLGKTEAHNSFNPSNQIWKNVLAENGYQTNQFQSILFLPFFHNGSEKLYIDRAGNDQAVAMAIAYQTGLPLIDCMMSRTSVSQTLSVAQIVSSSLIEKPIVKELKNKDILLIANTKNLAPEEKYLLSKSKKICEYAQFKFYAMPLSALENTSHFVQEGFATKKIEMYHDSIFNYYSNNPIQLFYKQDFDSLSSCNTFSGAGSLILNNEEKTIAKIPVKIAQTIWVEISFWANTYPETAAYPYLKYDCFDAENNSISSGEVNPKLSSNIKDTWVRASMDFELKPECVRLELKTSKSKQLNFDNLLVRHTAYDIIYDVKNDSSFMFNNYPVGK